jgi:hypothetical protein
MAQLCALRRRNTRARAVSCRVRSRARKLSSAAAGCARGVRAGAAGGASAHAMCVPPHSSPHTRRANARPALAPPPRVRRAAGHARCCAPPRAPPTTTCVLWRQRRLREACTVCCSLGCCCAALLLLAASRSILPPCRRRQRNSELGAREGAQRSEFRVVPAKLMFHACAACSTHAYKRQYRRQAQHLRRPYPTRFTGAASAAAARTRRQTAFVRAAASCVTHAAPPVRTLGAAAWRACAPPLAPLARRAGRLAPARGPARTCTG